MAAHHSPKQDNREIEWQLTAPDLSTVRQWLSTHPVIEHLAIKACPTLSIHDTYFDTHEWHIFRAGYALRLRVEQGRREASLKGIRSAREDVADREEITESLDDAPVQLSNSAAQILSLPGQVGTTVRKLLDSSELHVLFEVRTSRERYVAVNDQGAQGEIALDDSQFSAPGAAAGLTLTRVEVETLRAEHQHIERLVKALHSECRLERASESKFATGLKLAGLKAPPVSRSS